MVTSSGKEAAKGDEQTKYKGIRQCYRLLHFSVCGTYVNFGVFRLYGDQIMDRCLQTIFDLIAHVPIATMMVFPLSLFFSLSFILS